jgi:threonine/homoserine/homoserine lactone efflux protein
MPIDAADLVLFMVAALALNVTPGPDMLFVLANSIRHGSRAGVVAALGIGGGALAHTAAAALGVSALLLASPLAFDVVRYLGAGYLLWLGIQAIRTRPRHADSAAPADDLSSIFWRGVITNVLNPKVALFFLAFLPQFVNAGAGGVTRQMLWLGLLFNLSGTLVNVGVALAASFVGARLPTRPEGAGYFRWLTGSVFVGLGLRLALSGRN